MSSTWKNADDKAAAIKLRRDQERHLGATIDRLVHQTEMEPSGCVPKSAETESKMVENDEMGAN